MTSTKTDPPECSPNNLKDIIEWLKMGDIVVLHSGNKYGQIYHRCSETTSLENIRVIYVDVANHASLLDEGEWPWYIINQGHTSLCDCDLKSDALNAVKVPHIYRFEINY